MAEQNILNGDQEKLEQILGDLKEHKEKKERLDKLEVIVKELTKELESTQKEKKDETDSKIKASIDAISEGYDKSINANKDKIKAVTARRDKAKMAGVKERINAETASLRAENEDLSSQINEAFIHENISKFCNGRIFVAIFNAKRVVDYIIDIAILMVMLIAVPVGLYLVPCIPEFVLLLYGVIVSLFFVIIIKCMYRGIIIPHKETIYAAQDTKNRIIENKKRIKKIEKNIRKDKNEDMYGLDEYDTDINNLHDDIVKIESEKQEALDEFEKTTKADILEEIDERYQNKIDNMETELSKKKEEFNSLDDLVKKQRIYISSNYEAYLGKEFINIDKLTELKSIMKSGSADTISQAMAVYNNRH